MEKDSREHNESDIISSPTPCFYGTYLKIAADNAPDDIDSETLNLLKDRGFTKYIINNEDPVISVKILSRIMSHSILKPQRLLVDNDDYYVAIDLFTNTYYICYRDLMMIDIDRYKHIDKDNQDIDILDEIKNKLKKYTEFFFRIYASRNGYHIFLINKSMDYKSDQSIQLMSDLGCDFYYIVYSYLRGWSVRLNKKKGEESTDILYTWIGDVIKGNFFSSDLPFQNCESDTLLLMLQSLNNITLDDRLETLTDLHIQLTNIFKDEHICSMPAP